MVIYMKTSIKRHLIITTVNHDRLTCLQDFLLCVASVLELRVYREEMFTLYYIYIFVSLVGSNL